MKERIYISGPMKGMVNLNKALFYETQKKLESEGFDVTNPHELICSDDYKECMKLDIRALTYCDTIYMLLNWKQSKGAMLEHMVAVMIGLKVIDYGN